MQLHLSGICKSYYHLIGQKSILKLNQNSMEPLNLDELLATLSKDLTMINNVDFKSHCQKCQQPVIGESVQFIQEDYSYHFHKECFVCIECLKLLDLSQPFFLNKNKPNCEGCYAKLVLGSCDKCKKTLTSAQVVKANKMQYHPECFTCHKCNVKLDSRYFQTPEDDYYCNDCHSNDFLPTCETCNKKIEPNTTGDTSLITTVSFKDKKYHQDCFVCSSCKNPFVDMKVFPVLEERLCKVCHTKRLESAGI